MEDLGNDAPLPERPAWEILKARIATIKQQGKIPVFKSGAGRYGLALEHALGIAQNSSKIPDFRGIEIKTKYGKTLQTLFSLKPSGFCAYADKNDFFARHSYEDSKRGRRALYTSIPASGDSLGFQLCETDTHVVVRRRGMDCLEYRKEDLEKSLMAKHGQTFFVGVSPHKIDKSTYISVENVVYCRNPSISNFVKLVKANRIYFDLTMASANGKVKDHGFLWRIAQDAIEELYETRVML